MYHYLKNKFKISSVLSILFFVFLIIYSFDTAKAQINDSINDIITLNLNEEVEILALGDPTHREGTITTHRIDLIKKLAKQRDFKVIAFESNIFDMYIAYQKFLKTGGNKDLFDGMYPIFVCKELIELFDFVKEQNAKGDSIIIAGFDTTFSGVKTFDNLKNSIDDYFRRNPQLQTKFSEEEKTAYYKSLYPLTHTGLSNLFVNRDKIYETLLPYTKLILSFMQSTKEQNKEEDIFLEQALTNVLQLRSADKKVSFEDPYNIRDKYMLDNMEFLREQYPNQKIILFGSTTHFYKDAKSIDGEFFQKDRMCFGGHLNKKFKDKYFFIAYSALSGSRKGAFATRQIKAPEANTLENTAQDYNPIVTGERNQLLNFSLLLNYPTTTFEDKINCRMMGHDYDKMKIEKVCDAIILIDDCKPYTKAK